MKNFISLAWVVTGFVFAAHASADTSMIPIIQAWMAPLEGKYGLQGSAGCDKIEIRKHEIEPDYEIYEIYSGVTYVAMYYVYETGAVKVTANNLHYSFEDRDYLQAADVAKDGNGKLKSIHFKMAKPTASASHLQNLFEYTCFAR